MVYIETAQFLNLALNLDNTEDIDQYFHHIKKEWIPKQRTNN